MHTPNDAEGSSSLLTTKVDSSTNSTSTHSYQQVPPHTPESASEQLLQPDTPSLSPSEPPKPHLISHQKDFFLDWTLKILGVACAILFGIWAPISFKLTSDGNKENDASQKAVFSQLGDIRLQAATAAQVQHAAASAIASVQFAAVSAMAGVEQQLGRIGRLRAMEFCEGRADQIYQCEMLSSSVDVGVLVAQLGGLRSSTPSADASSSVARTSTRYSSPTPIVSISSGVIPDVSSQPHGSSSSSSGVSKDVLAVILGSVFSAIVIIGLVVGLLARRRQWKKIQAGSNA